MKKIEITGMMFFAHHGWYEIERKIGQSFKVDISCLIADKKGKNISLENTIDYQSLYSRIKYNMGHTHQLLENLIDEMANDLLIQFSIIDSLTLKIYKQPILGGVFDEICISSTYNSKD